MFELWSKGILIGYFRVPFAAVAAAEYVDYYNSNPRRLGFAIAVTI